MSQPQDTESWIMLETEEESTGRYSRPDLHREGPIVDQTERFLKLPPEELGEWVTSLMRRNAILSRELINLRKQSNYEISALRREVTKLRETIEEIEVARTLVAEIPDSWIIDEE